ncbi:hypothetical protein ACTFIR_011827 [Dictyostelium discoideum]
MKQDKINEIINYLKFIKDNDFENTQHKNYKLLHDENGKEVINDYRMVSLWEEMHKCHIGRDATYGNYKTKYYNIGLYSFVSDAVDTCDICQRNRIKGITKDFAPIVDTEEYSRLVYDLTSIKGEHKEKVTYDDDSEKILTKLDDLIQYDSVQPYDADVVYIILCIDSFTKFATGRCLTTKRTVPIYNFLALKYFGKPVKVWHCDNGREFKNKGQQEFLKLFPGSKSAHGAPRTPTTQGMVERLNQTIKERISKLKQQDFLDGTSRSLSELLKQALDDYNNTNTRTIKMTPSQAVGIVPLFINVQSEQDSQSIGVSDVSKEERTAIILENLTSYQNKWNSKPPKGLKVGDTVLLLEIKKNNKILILCKIHKVIQEGTKQLYKLEFLEDGINSLQKKGLYSGFVGGNKLVLYKQSTVDIFRTSPNIPKDIDSFTSGLYLNNDKKVIEFLVQVIKNLGKDLSNFNLHQLVTQNDPFRVLEDALNNPSNISPIINDNPFQHKLNNEMEQEEILPFLNNNPTAPNLMNCLRQDMNLKEIVPQIPHVHIIPSYTIPQSGSGKVAAVKRLRGRPHKIPIVNKPPSKSPSKSPLKLTYKSPSAPPFKSPSKSPFKSPPKSPFKSPFKSLSTSLLKSPSKSPFKSPTISPCTPPFESPSKSPFKSPFKPPSKSPSKSPSIVNVIPSKKVAKTKLTRTQKLELDLVAINRRGYGEIRK